MPENKETIMYIGGTPQPKEKADAEQQNSEAKEDRRSEFDKKWDKYISGEATFQELSTYFTKCDIKELKKAKVGNVFGFSGDLNKLRVLTVHVGYSKEEIENKSFQNYMKRNKAEVENLFGKKNIELGFYIPDEKMPTLTSYGFGRAVGVSDEECAVLKRKIQKKYGQIDILDIRVNPEIVGNTDFGTAHGTISQSPGPIKNKKGEYKLYQKFVIEHELMHSISSCTRKHNPMSFGDGYYHNLSYGEARDIVNGNHLEFIPADENGNPIFLGKTINKTMKKVLETANLKDKNVFIEDQKGTRCKVLLINPGVNFMRYDLSDKERAEAIRKGTYITKAQRIAIDDVIKDYLIGEKRLVTDKEVQKPKLVTKNNSAKTSLVSKIAKSNNARG